MCCQSATLLINFTYCLKQLSSRPKLCKISLNNKVNYLKILTLVEQTRLALLTHTTSGYIAQTAQLLQAGLGTSHTYIVTKPLTSSGDVQALAQAQARPTASAAATCGQHDSWLRCLVYGKHVTVQLLRPATVIPECLYNNQRP